MQRFAAERPLALPPGAALRLGAARHAQLVDSVVLDDGRCEFLAVTAWPPAPDEVAVTGEGAEDAALAPLIECRPLPLPYALPA